MKQLEMFTKQQYGECCIWRSLDGLRCTLDGSRASWSYCCMRGEYSDACGARLRRKVRNKFLKHNKGVEKCLKSIQNKTCRTQ